jgi:hypothetical protein
MFLNHLLAHLLSRTGIIGMKEALMTNMALLSSRPTPPFFTGLTPSLHNSRKRKFPLRTLSFRLIQKFPMIDALKKT